MVKVKAKLGNQEYEFDLAPSTSSRASHKVSHKQNVPATSKKWSRKLCDVQRDVFFERLGELIYKIKLEPLGW